LPRLTRELEDSLYSRGIRPIIVQSPRCNEIWHEISSLIPTNIKGYIKTLFPVMAGAAEAALADPKLIPMFNLLSFPATPLIIEQLAQDHRVDTIFPDRIMNAFKKIPDQGVYIDGLNNKKFTTTYWTKKLLGIAEANVEGWTGKGVKVVIADTGAGLHQQIPFVQHQTVMRGQYTDGSGHGTYCATVIGGRDAQDPAFRVSCSGMAPDADLISVKCLGYIIGAGKESDFLAALQKAAELGADIVNVSLGSDQVPGRIEDDPTVAAINMLTEQNRICVVASGNTGPKAGTLNSPGIAPDALTVGALDEITGDLADFSSRGPSPWSEDPKPDVIAPGVRVDSGTINLLDIQGDRRPQRFSYLCGTSIAAPHVAGLLACARQMLLSKGVLLDTKLVKEICQMYGEDKNNDRGWGMLTFDHFKSYIQEHT